MILQGANSESCDKTDIGEMKGTVSSKTYRNQLLNCFMEISVRVILFIIFIQIERTPAYIRKIQPEELWLYKNSPKSDIVPAAILLPASFVIPFTIILINYLITRCRNDFIQANNVITLSLCFTGVITSMLKITIGRPRPDFYYRCFPDGHVPDDMECIGELRIVNEGRKSFPSGHSSFAFAGLGFAFLYLAAKLHVFNEKGRGHSWRLCLSVFPLFVASLVAISRICDNHHHWQDVVIGSLIGMANTYVCYRQYYPSIFSPHCQKPYSNSIHILLNGSLATDKDEDTEIRPLIEEEKDTKWI